MSDAGRGNRDAELLDAWRPILEARREIAKLEAAQKKQRERIAKTHRKRQDPSRRAKAKKLAERRKNDKLELAELRRRPRGPGLHRWQFHSPQSYAVASVDLVNLEVLAPCAASGRARGLKLFDEHRDELRRRAAKVDVKAKALRLLYLVAWAGNYERGLQGSMTELAELVGVSRSYCYDLAAELEQRGLIRRHQRDRRYANLTGDLLSHHFVGADGELRPLKRWMDAEGKLHTFVDVESVLYVTRKGLRSILSLERGRRGAALQQGLWTALWNALRNEGRRISARKNAALAAPKNRTPSTGKSHVDTIYRARGNSTRGLPVDNSGGTGPPSG